MSSHDYDFFVIGGGSGGVRAARLAAQLGLKVAIAEEHRFGGTCVIRGCVPKKLLVYASHFSEYFEDAAGYGWSVGETSFDWPTLVSNKDRELDRLENAYRTNVVKSGAEIIDSRAVLEGVHNIRLVADNRVVTADQILIAVGGHPNPHQALEGHELCIFSNEAFDLPVLPEKIVIAGGGYIATEFANIFHGLGVETTLLYRGQHILSGFDVDLRENLQSAMEAKGIRVICHQIFSKVERRSDGRLDAHLSEGEVLDVDQVMLALGRLPNTGDLGLDTAGVEVSDLGAIEVDDYSRSSVPNIWAIGDVTHRVELTPVAIHEAICLVQTAFRNNPQKPDYDTIATAVFSQPEIGTVGLTQDAAEAKYEEIEIYRASFRPMRNVLAGRDEKMMVKLIVNAADRVVVGAHILGPDAGEMAQLLGIALKARLTKDQFDATMAVHPTAAEELVTMYEPTVRLRHGEVIENKLKN